MSKTTSSGNSKALEAKISPIRAINTVQEIHGNLAAFNLFELIQSYIEKIP